MFFINRLGICQVLEQNCRRDFGIFRSMKRARANRYDLNVIRVSWRLIFFFLRYGYVGCDVLTIKYFLEWVKINLRGFGPGKRVSRVSQKSHRCERCLPNVCEVLAEAREFLGDSLKEKREKNSPEQFFEKTKTEKADIEFTKRRFMPFYVFKIPKVYFYVHS